MSEPRGCWHHPCTGYPVAWGQLVDGRAPMCWRHAYSTDERLTLEDLERVVSSARDGKRSSGMVRP